MTLTMGACRIEVEPEAAEYIAAHGGRLYVTVSSAGLVHEATAPEPAVNYSESSAGEITLCVDPAIEQPEFWRLAFHRFPRPHVRALWNGSGGFSSPASPFASRCAIARHPARRCTQRAGR